MTKSRVIHVRISKPKQHQMIMSSATRFKFFTNKVIFRYHTKGVSNQVPSNSDLEIKIYSSSNSSSKMGESGKNFSPSQNWAIRGLNMGGGFRDYKSRQERLQIMEILGISNRDKKITNRRSDYKLVQNIRNYQNLCSSRTVNFSQLSFFFFQFDNIVLCFVSYTSFLSISHDY